MHFHLCIYDSTYLKMKNVKSLECAIEDTHFDQSGRVRAPPSKVADAFR